MFLFHNNQRIENSVAKQYAGNGQDRDDDLSEARYFAGALQDASGYEVSDEDRSV